MAYQIAGIAEYAEPSGRDGPREIVGGAERAAARFLVYIYIYIYIYILVTPLRFRKALPKKISKFGMWKVFPIPSKVRFQTYNRLRFATNGPE